MPVFDESVLRAELDASPPKAVGVKLVDPETAIIIATTSRKRGSSATSGAER